MWHRGRKTHETTRYVGASRRAFLTGCGGFCSTLFSRSVFSQELVTADAMRSACSWNAATRNVDTWLFQSSELAKKIMGEVVDAIGLKPNFEVRAGSVPNAAAYIDTKTFNRMIVYSESWAQQTFGRNDAGTSYWMGIALLAHECAHHYNNDTLELLKTNVSVNAFAVAATANHKKELAADEFAGFVVGRMNGSLQQAQALFLTLPETASDSHPVRSVRVEAATVGWRRARPDAGVTAPATCQQDWIGPQFKAQGVDCRQLRLCPSGQPKTVVACRDTAQNKWFYE